MTPDEYRTWLIERIVEIRTKISDLNSIEYNAVLLAGAMSLESALEKFKEVI